MPKKNNQGSYEMVDSQSFGKDLESGFPEGSNSTDAEIFKNRFDTIAGPKYSRFSLRSLKRRKYLVVLIVLALFFIAASGLYTSQNGLDVLDYYKNKVKGSGGSDPEVENNSGNRDQPVDGIKADGEAASVEQDAAEAPKAAVIDEPKGEDGLKITIEKEPEAAVQVEGAPKVETAEEVAKENELKVDSAKAEQLKEETNKELNQ
ncbi:unnamed protein product [Wickerhamomyces anomalus]